LSRANQALRQLFTRHLFTRQQWLKLALWVFVIVPVAPFIIGSLGLMIYMYWPISYHNMTSHHEINSAQSLTIIAHGLNSSPQEWSHSLKQAITSHQPQRQVIAVDWSEYATNAFRCSVDGKRIGANIAAQLVDKQLPEIHLIGHSCGAFVVLGLCQALREQDQAIKIHTTYLDPVSIYGGLWWNYGIAHFGQCADFSDAYIDTRDTIPGSNQALEHAYTFDVSSLSKVAGYQGKPHQWPIHYYIDRMRKMATLTLAAQPSISQRYQKNVLYPQTTATYNKINTPSNKRVIDE